MERGDERLIVIIPQMELKHERETRTTWPRNASEK
jgi:hypothetical protein